jgi:hypothetical protein
MEIKEMDRLSKQIADIAPMLVCLDKTITVTNKEIESLVKTSDLAAEERKKIRATLYGNGDHEGGMVGRMHKAELWIENQVWFQRLLIALLVSEALGIIYIVVNHVLGS